MSCSNIKSQLDTQLEDIEKNRGVLNILKTSVAGNPLLNYLADNIIANQPTSVPETTSKDLISKLESQVGNAAGLVQTMLASFFTIPGNFIDCYYYYLLHKQFEPWLLKRQAVVSSIISYLEQIDSLASNNFYFKLSPSAIKEYQSLMIFLEGARESLLQIPYIEVTVRDENGNIIQRGYELPGSIPASVDLSDITDFASLKKIPVFYFTMRAFSLLEKGQDFLRNTLSTKTLTEHERTIQERLKTFLAENNTILSGLSTLIPVPLTEILTNLDFVKKTVTDDFGTTAKKILGLSSEDTLVLLDGKIGIVKALLKSFETIYETFVNQTSQSIQKELASFHNIELDKLISDIKGKEFPLNLYDFYLKAPGWYARIEVIKYSLFFFNFTEFSSEQYGMSNSFKVQHSELKKYLEMEDQGLLFEKALISSFPEITKLLYIGNFFSSSRKTFSVEYLMELANNTYSQDEAFLQMIDTYPVPDNYAIFEKMFSSGLNVLQSSSVLGPVTNLVSEGLQTGLFMALPSLIGMDPQTALTSAVSSLSSLYKAIPGIEEFSSTFEYLTGGFNFEQCDTLKDKNLFLNPYVDNPTESEIVDGIADSYKELWTSINGRIE